MFHLGEVVNMVVAVAVAPLLLLGAKPFSRATWSKMVVAYLLMVVGYGVSIIEGFILPPQLNVAEHVLYMSGALFFLWFAAERAGRMQEGAGMTLDLIAGISIITTLAFVAAAILAATTPVSEEGPMTRAARLLLVLAFSVYVVTALGNVLQYTGRSNFVDLNLEAVLKAVFMPLLAYAAYILRFTMRLKQSRQSERMVQAPVRHAPGDVRRDAQRRPAHRRGWPAASGEPPGQGDARPPAGARDGPLPGARGHDMVAGLKNGVISVCW